MLFLKRTLLSLGLAALILAPGIFSASQIATADSGDDGTAIIDGGGGEGDDASGVNTPPEVVPEPSESPSAEPSESPSAEPSESPSAEPSESPSAKPSKSPGTNPPAKVKKPTKSNKSTANSRKAGSASVSNAKRVSGSAGVAVASALSAARDVIDAKADDAKTGIVEHQTKEAPNPPVTGSSKSKKSAGADTASAAVLVNDELTLASSRASLLAFAACGAFAIVAAASVVTARRLMPRY